jgi:hypothetical protein
MSHSGTTQRENYQSKERRRRSEQGKQERKQRMRRRLLKAAQSFIRAVSQFNLVERLRYSQFCSRMLLVSPLRSPHLPLPLPP